MALFCVAIRRDSVFRFPFRMYAQIFSCEMSPVHRLKCSYSYFFFSFSFFLIHFCSVDVLISVKSLVAVISLPMHIFI